MFTPMAHIGQWQYLGNSQWWSIWCHCRRRNPSWRWGNDTYAFDKFFGSDVIEEPLYFRDQDTQIPVSQLTVIGLVHLPLQRWSELQCQAKQPILKASRKDQIIKDFLPLVWSTVVALSKKTNPTIPSMESDSTMTKAIAEDDLIDRLESEFWYSPRNRFHCNRRSESRETLLQNSTPAIARTLIFWSQYTLVAWVTVLLTPKFLGSSCEDLIKTTWWSYSQEGETSALGGDSLLLKPKSSLR